MSSFRIMEKMPKTVVLTLIVLFFNALALNASAEELRSCGGLGAATLNKKADIYKAEISKASKKYGVNQSLIKSIIASESCFREMVVSCKGASGLMQLMPSTAAMYGTLDLFDAAENIDAGTRHLASLLRRYNGSLTHVIAAYNAGEGRIGADAPVTISFKETRGYINNVLTALTKFETTPAGNQRAQLLLAQWQQSEREYQAALRGEPLPPTVMLTALEQQTPTTGTTAQAKLQSGGTPGLLLAPPNATAMQRSGRVTTQLPGGAVSPEQLSPEQQAALQELTTPETPLKTIKTKSGKTVVLALTNPQAPAALAEPNIKTKPREGESVLPPNDVVIEDNQEQAQAQVEPTVSANPAQAKASSANDLVSCDTMPETMVNQAHPGGSGRYAVYFYQAPAGESLMGIADKLGVDVREILRLNRLQLDDMPHPGQKLKVAECLR